MRAWTADNLDGYAITGGGPTLMFAQLGEQNIRSMLTALTVTLLAAALIMGAVFRSGRIAGIGLICNLLPVLLVFSAWAVAHGRISIGAAVVLGMVLGIVLDDTIYLLATYRRAIKRKLVDPIGYALHRVGAGTGRHDSDAGVRLEPGPSCPNSPCLAYEPVVGCDHWHCTRCGLAAASGTAARNASCGRCGVTPDWYQAWSLHLRAAGPRMSDRQMEATARLATVLLCGEQSAVQVFAAEVRRGRAPAEALAALRTIEQDEHLHERSLLDFCEYLPKPDGLHTLKRRAQRFFAELGRIDDMARHFGQISHLDSVVCRIMWHIERSAIDKASPLRLIATQIKKDEARHVAVSRRYAASLGLKPSERGEDGTLVAERMVGMLGPLADSFETVGIDSDRLFANIQRSKLP